MTAQVCFNPAFIAEQFLLESLLTGKSPEYAPWAHATAQGKWGPRKASCSAGGGSPGAASAACAGPCADGFRRRRCSSPGGRPIDVIETESEWLLYVDVPGYSLQDLKVSVHEGELVISGEAATSDFFKLPEDAHVRRAERRPARSFSRTFELPAEVEINTIRAKVELGVLRVTLPKVVPPPKQGPVTIPIEDPMDADTTAAPPVTDAHPTAGAAAQVEQIEAPAAEEKEGWVDVDADAKGKAPMEPEVAAAVEAQLQELKVANDAQANEED